jgi:dihydrofolate synthase / folylpolyglutamate synthase
MREMRSVRSLTIAQCVSRTPSGAFMGRYQDALDYIFSFVNYERQARYAYNAVTFSLQRMEELLERLGNPHHAFRSVHIAGTKGKGSTSVMVESVLRMAGYRTGLYTSPHLHTFRERIRLNGALMSKSDLVEMLERSRPAMEATQGITAFEIMTALAFVYFAERGVEWAVLEVGLGGRLDATNVIHPAVGSITSLSYDHVELLGHTLSLIAWEKAGIIKPGVPIVSAPQEPEAMGIIRRVCADTGARLVVIGEDWTVEGDGTDLAGQAFTVMRHAAPGAVAPVAHGTVPNVLPDLHVRLLGRHQLINATTAVAILWELSTQGVDIPENALRAGLVQARWPGRFEVLSRSPGLVVDSAHNTDSAMKLRAALAEWFPRPPRNRLALVFGASADKDIDGMLHAFLKPDPAIKILPADKVIVTKSYHPRAADLAGLADHVRTLNPNCPISVHDNLDSALTEALAWAGHDDLICVTGSIFVVAQARRAWAKRHPGAFPPDDWVFQDESNGPANDAEPRPTRGARRSGAGLPQPAGNTRWLETVP